MLYICMHNIMLIFRWEVAKRFEISDNTGYNYCMGTGGAIALHIFDKGGLSPLISLKVGIDYIDY